MATIAELMVKLKADNTRFKQSIKESRASIKRFETTSTKSIAKTNAGFKRLGTTAGKLKTKLLGVAAAALAVGAAFGKIASTGRNFSAAIAELSAITGATGADLVFLTNAAREFGKTTTLSATQVAQAFKQMASARPDLLKNAQALKAVTKEAIALAEAAGIDVPDAAETLGSAMNQFGADAKQAGRFINVLAAGAKLGASFIPETAQALKEAGIVAAQAGISFEETNAAIQLLAKDSIKGARAGTALRNIFLILQSQTDRKLNPAIVGLSTALDNLAKKELSVAQMAKLFGRESLVAASSLLKNKDSLDALTASLTGTSVAYEQAAIKAASFDGQMKSLTSSIEGASLALFARMKPALGGIVKSLTAAFRAVDAGISSFQNLTQLGIRSLGILQKGWANFKFSVLAVWESIKAGFMASIQFMSKIFANFVKNVAIGLSKIPGLKDRVKGLEAWADSILFAQSAQTTLGKTIDSLKMKRLQEISVINLQTQALLALEGATRKTAVTQATAAGGTGGTAAPSPASFGSITDPTTGRTLSIGNKPEQKVKVEIIADKQGLVQAVVRSQDFEFNTKQALLATTRNASRITE